MVQFYLRNNFRAQNDNVLPEVQLGLDVLIPSPFLALDGAAVFLTALLTLVLW